LPFGDRQELGPAACEHAHVVHHHIYAPEAVQREPPQFVERGVLAYVASHPSGLTAGAGDLGNDGVSRLGIDVGNHDARAAPGEGPGLWPGRSRVPLR
jgi:hypothetical protein